MGTPKDEMAALGWFAAAGELGHRGARSHFIRRTSEDIEPLTPTLPPTLTLPLTPILTLTLTVTRRTSEDAKDAKLQSYADRFEQVASRRAGEWQALSRTPSLKAEL